MDIYLGCGLFALGLALGSFLNVCITRIPRDESTVAPGSHCRTCLAAIRWRDNVPVLSWLMLRGRCRACRARISVRYPLVEILTAVAFVACFALYGSTWLAARSCLFSFLVLGLIFMDVETGLLPAEFTYTGTILGLSTSWLVAYDSAGTAFLLRSLGFTGLPAGHLLSLIDGLAGALVGAAFFYLAWALYYLVRKRDGLGFGDIAFMAMAGAFLGLKLTVLVIFAAPLIGTLYAVAALLFRRAQRQSISGSVLAFREQTLPFGAFLGVSSLAALFAGGAIWDRYLAFFR